MRGKLKRFLVMCNGYSERTRAVSAEKAINNVRYRMFLKAGNWYGVPRASEFDAVEE